jgi:hypothetical protein
VNETNKDRIRTLFELHWYVSPTGIMQLALLAPYNNLASSVAAALVPTLLTPKIRITDENSQTFSFGSDSNSQPMDASQQQDNGERSIVLGIFRCYPHRVSQPVTSITKYYIAIISGSS